MRAVLSAVAAAFAVAVFAVAAPVPKPGEEKLAPPTEEQLKKSQNNLKQILIAIHCYSDANGVMPNNVLDEKKKPQLSWRVHLLPYLEEENLYKQFKLDEPWDSETNKKLIEKLPAVFAPIRVKAKAGETFYRGFTGPGAVFEAGARYGLAQIPDGTSNTIGVVEAGEPCLWTKPDDLEIGEKKPLPMLGGMFGDTFHVATMDGAVYTVDGKKMKAEAFKGMLVRNSGLVRDTDGAFGK